MYITPYLFKSKTTFFINLIIGFIIMFTFIYGWSLFLTLFILSPIIVLVTLTVTVIMSDDKNKQQVP